MRQVLLMPPAEQDLREINAYIRQDNPVAATRFVARLKRACQSLAAVPLRGVARDDLRPGVRQIVEHKYRIIYRVTPESVEVLRIVHGAREIRKI